MPDPDLFRRLDELVRTHAELTAALADPALIADHARYRQTARRHAELEHVVEVYAGYRLAVADAQAARELVRESSGKDRELFRAEAEENDQRAGALAER
ncbi:MAG: PCRF domain-containing protein, partial [Nitriliruptorales bacterium]|nr:PCRF domain-containing protein [Nitriliruptorales bacterium]